jgi:hypothetical protein
MGNGRRFQAYHPLRLKRHILRVFRTMSMVHGMDSNEPVRISEGMISMNRFLCVPVRFRGLDVCDQQAPIEI